MSDIYRPGRTAWEHAASQSGGKFVRVRIGEGKWVGGWLGPDSFLDVADWGPALYIDTQYHVDAAGVFGEQVEGTAGVWLRLRDGDIVEWVHAPADEDDIAGDQGRPGP